MRRILSAAALVALTASVASAAPTITFVQLASNANAPAGSTTWLIQASNPGTPTPFPRVEAINFTLTSPTNSIWFQTNPDPDTGDPVISPTALPVAPGTRTLPTGTYVSLPAQGIGATNPANVSQNAGTVQFVNITSAANQTTATTNLGAIVLTAGGTASIASDPSLATNYFQIGSTKYPLSGTFGGVVVTPAAFGAGTLGGSDARQSLATTGDNPTIYTLTIDFGNLGSVPANFSVDTNMTESGTIASVGALPSGITASAAGDVISGTVSGGLRGSFDIALTGSTPGADTAILRIVAIPEPATLSVLAGVGLLALRRRK